MDNLVAMRGSLNLSKWKVMELKWLKKLEENNEVQVIIKVKYPEGTDSLRPEKFVVKWRYKKPTEEKWVNWISENFDN